MTYPGEWPNGHKDWLKRNAKEMGTTKNAICHAALYLGRVIEQATWVLGWANAGYHKPPQWWLDKHPAPEEAMEDGG